MHRATRVDIRLLCELNITMLWHSALEGILYMSSAGEDGSIMIFRDPAMSGTVVTVWVSHRT